MLKFVNIGQQNPPKRPKSERKEDFNEIYQEFLTDKAKGAIKQMLSVWCTFLPSSLSFK